MELRLGGVGYALWQAIDHASILGKLISQVFVYEIFAASKCLPHHELGEKGVKYILKSIFNF